MVLLKLHQYEEASKVINSGLELLQNEPKTAKCLKHQVALTAILAKVLLENANGGKFVKVEHYKETYLATIELQRNLIEKLKENGSSDVLEREKEYAAQLCFELAQYQENAENDIEGAKVSYADGLRLFDAHKASLLALAKLLGKRGEWEACVSLCNKLLKVDPANDEATYLSTDVMWQKKDQKELALSTFKSLMAVKADNTNILAKFIIFAKRIGKVQETKEYIDVATKMIGRSNDPGLSYCKGLYQRFTYNNQEALQSFNVARADRIFARNALINLIDLYLNLDVVPWCASDLYYSTVEDTKITNARGLVEELDIRCPNDPLVLVYKAYCDMLKADRSGVDSANSILTDLFAQRKDYVPLLLAMTVLKFIQKKPGEAKNLLIAIDKLPYQSEEDVHFERGYTMLGIHYMSSNGFDQALASCQKCLKCNQCDINAEELFGVIREKQNSLTEAASHYEIAWELSNHTSHTVGFRLASLNLKLKKYVECIKVSKDLLSKYPGYKVVETDILAKAINSVRT